MAEKNLLKLDIPTSELPVVGQLFYQPISRRHVPATTEIEWLTRRALAAAIDGEALILASTLRDLKKLGISPTDESFIGLGGITPLHLAVEANSPATLCVLIDHGCDVNVRDRVGDTPAHTAARLNFIECIKILGSPQALADFSIINDDSLTPSELAFIGGHHDAVEAIKLLQAEDESEHMAKRTIAEAARQRKMVRMKETFFGRPFTSFEGGRDFEIPTRALLNDEHILRVASNVRAFASVPAVVDAGMRKALSKLAKERTESLGQITEDDDSIDMTLTNQDESSVSDNIGKQMKVDEQLLNVGANKPVVDWDDLDDERDCYIPGRIATSRWIDFSKGRPPDLGYSSCV